MRGGFLRSEALKEPAVSNDFVQLHLMLSILEKNRNYTSI